MHTLASAQAALRAGAWERAAAAFAAVTRETADPLGYEGLAQAAWWLDDGDTCLRAGDDAYRRHRELRDDRGAARAATGLAWNSALFGRGDAVALGWLELAGSLLEPLDETPEHGWLAVRQAELDLAVRHDPRRALAAAELASAVGRRQHSGDLAVVGLALEGLALTSAGEVEQGTRRLDSAAAAATSGDVGDVMWIGKVCCWLISACQATEDLARAEDWCRRVATICAERDLQPLFNVCRIQYAAVQVATGTWEDAERELTAALGRLSGSARSSRLDAVVQLGELRRRQGRLEEADALLRQAEFHPTAVVGRALIRLANGDAAGAWSTLRSLLRTLDAGTLVRSQALLPAVRAAHAAGDPVAAADVTAELRDVARSRDSRPLLARAATAEAVLAAPGEAAPLLQESVRLFHLAGLRHEEAEARLRLAAALHAAGDAPAAREQLDLATAALTGLDAAAGLAEARRLAADIGDHRRGVLTGRETEVLRLVARGMSNPAIARTLVLSEHTVHRHVANILTKLDQPSRAGAATYAVTAGLL